MFEAITNDHIYLAAVDKYMAKGENSEESLIRIRIINDQSGFMPNDISEFHPFFLTL